MVDIHTVWNRFDGTIELNSRNMPFGLSTNEPKQETFTSTGNCWKGKSDQNYN
jgi:hypothetical protein